MLNRGKALSALLAAVATLLVAAGGASATRIELNNEGFRIIWNPMRFQSSELTEITCKVTLAGTFASRTIEKVSGRQIGSVTSASIEECRGGTIVFLTETLPWALLYSSFTGTLPNIEAITTLLTGMRLRWGTISTCLYRVVAEAPQRIDLVRRRETGQLILANLFQSWISSESLGCSTREIRLSGSGAPTIGGGFEGLFARLIP